MKQLFLSLRKHVCDTNKFVHVEEYRFMVTELTNKLDKIFHDRVRLGIMTILIARKQVTFTELVNELNLTRGNTSVHMKVLEQNEYITVTKEFVENKPRTTFSITEKGKKAFENYLEMLEQIIKGINK